MPTCVEFTNRTTGKPDTIHHIDESIAAYLGFPADPIRAYLFDNLCHGAMELAFEHRIADLDEALPRVPDFDAKLAQGFDILVPCPRRREALGRWARETWSGRVWYRH